MIVVTSRIRVAAGDADALADQYRRRLHAADAFPGSLGVEILRRVDAPAEFMVYTRWTSAEAYHTYRAAPAFRDAHARIPAGLKVVRVEEGVGEFEVL